MPRSNVTVLGSGLMGSALARHAATRRSVTVWNRTTANTSHLADADVTIAETLDVALRSADVVLIVLADYAVGTAVVEEHLALLRGKDVINVMTGSPREADDFARMVEAAGGRYLDGAIEAYPNDIGMDDTLINFAGSPELWHEERELLTSIAGQARWVGSSPGAANVLDAAFAGGFYNVSIGAFLEAAHFATASGVSIDEVGRSIDYWITLLSSVLHEAVHTIASGNHATDQATLSVYLAAVRTWRDAMIQSGTRSSLMTANMHNLEIAEASGAGGQGVFAQIDTMSAGPARDR